MLSRLLPLLMLFPAIAPAISHEMQEFMRDVALLQQQLKDLQQSQDTKFAALTVMVQQTLDSATKANTAVAVLESGLRGAMQEQLKGVVGSAVGRVRKSTLSAATSNRCVPPWRTSIRGWVSCSSNFPI